MVWSRLFSNGRTNLALLPSPLLNGMSDNACAKLAPDSLQNNTIKNLMRYTGGHRTSPLQKVCWGGGGGFMWDMVKSLAKKLIRCAGKFLR